LRLNAISNTLAATASKEKYDATMKELLANKQILA